MIRVATLSDLDALVEIENACFELDRLSRRSFRHMLTKGKASTLVWEDERGIQAYIITLFNSGTSLARIYSIAVMPQAQGLGLGRKLVEAAEQVAIDQDRVYVRLEIRPDNQASIALFERMGYRQFGLYLDYYEDHMDALRFEKRLQYHPAPYLAKVPYYQQTLDFTCGPASLMMAMKALDDSLVLDRQLELRLWRESTTIFMTAGHGGCGPYGMALAALHRGFEVEVYVKENEVMFIDSVRSEEKKEVIQLVEEDFMQEIESSDITLHYHRLSTSEINDALDAGGIPVILISSYRIYKEKFPHWVIITGHDDRFIYFHDPYIDEEKGKTMTDCVNMPIPIEEFERMTRYGKSGQRAALILYAKKQQDVVQA